MVSVVVLTSSRRDIADDLPWSNATPLGRGMSSASHAVAPAQVIQAAWEGVDQKISTH